MSRIINIKNEKVLKALKGNEALRLVKEGLKLEDLPNSYYRKLFLLCEFRPKKLMGFFFMFYCAYQILAATLETVIWGETFPHFIDGIVAVALGIVLLDAMDKLGDFLLSQVTESEPEPEPESGPVIIIDNTLTEPKFLNKH